MERKALGICLGASNVKVVELVEDEQGIRISRSFIHNHESNPRSSFIDILREFEFESYDYGMVTGRKFREMVNAPSITEPEAVECALEFIKSERELPWDPGAVVSLGAESFITYVLDNEGKIAHLETGNKCASGTGEFFLQQIRRMDISVDEAVSLAQESEEFHVSGRCSVFCKSDCTHALNRGIPVGRVTAGLCRMMSEKVLDLLEKVPQKKIVAVGGVTHNSVIVRMLKNKLDGLFVPECADVFEAVGAAWYALKNQKRWEVDRSSVFKNEHISFDILPPVMEGHDKVRFETFEKAEASDGDELIIGLDVGSTTTKAVALRPKDDAIVASVYLRTNGNPVKASRDCYRELDRQIQADVSVVGLGTTGSGRQIAGLHAGTDAVINEIIAHATAAAYFDAEVDTIFEIGGQDAKYTFLVNGVPADYAMNEACSAGTGSFLEESAKETLGIGYLGIEKVAMHGSAPPNFNDQCAAFISSDIKTATHEGIEKEDIVAGLVYSICMNYVNRVKGQRPVGKRIFMQGGVCYNRAVPLAMANLIGKDIIVPPEPGLMGAYGVALEVKKRFDQELLERSQFDLKTLFSRGVEYGKRFICRADSTCDRACEINMMIIDEKKYPFGGACNRYYNLIHDVTFDAKEFDFVKKRQSLLFEEFGSSKAGSGKRIGMNRSFLTHMLYPLFSTFFTELGFELVLSDDVDPEGVKRKRSSFCYPGEIAHGAYANLLKKELDYIFLPKILELFVENALTRRREHQCTCLLLQSEAYFLKSAFKGMHSKAEVLSPTLDFSQGFETQKDEMIQLAHRCGIDDERAAHAYDCGLEAQRQYNARIKDIGKRIIEEIESDSERIAIVLFGRPYNAFAKEANMGIPGKFSSRGITVIPWDFLPYENECCEMDINWAIGQNLMKASSYVGKHPQLFASYITNFSCGPDSFLVGYFRNIMKTKPSLTLELDSHTADAGINTRIEAFLDIIAGYRRLERTSSEDSGFVPAKIVFEKRKPIFVASDGSRHTLDEPSVHLLLPSMGRLSSEGIAAVFDGAGIRTSALPVYDHEALKFGRGNTSCKECLPLILTTGGLLKYLEHRNDPNEHLIYFMPTCGGNCRFTQYNVFLKKFIEKNSLPNIALLSLTNENGYAGLSMPDALNVLKSVIITDCMEDIKNALLVCARDPERAEKVFWEQWERIVDSFRERRGKGIYKILKDIALELSDIPLRIPLSEAKKVALLGEIFVRRDYFSCQDLIKRLAKRDIVVRRAPVLEWLVYCDYNVQNGIYEAQFDMIGALEFKTRLMLQKKYEQKIKKILAGSGLYDFEMIDMDKIIEYGSNLFDVRFTGEAILVVGSFFKEMFHSIQGAISIGPFACMPTRIIEAVLSAESTLEVKNEFDKKQHDNCHMVKNISNLPFLSIETDGNPFPQVLEARVEAFSLQVERLYEKLNKKTQISDSFESAKPLIPN